MACFLVENGVNIIVLEVETVTCKLSPCVLSE